MSLPSPSLSRYSGGSLSPLFQGEPPTHPDLAGFVVLVFLTVISLPHVLPLAFLLQPGFKLRKAKGANWRRVDSAGRPELEPGHMVTVRSQGSVGPVAEVGPDLSSLVPRASNTYSLMNSQSHRSCKLTISPLLIFSIFYLNSG